MNITVNICQRIWLSIVQPSSMSWLLALFLPFAIFPIETGLLLLSPWQQPSKVAALNLSSWPIWKYSSLLSGTVQSHTVLYCVAHISHHGVIRRVHQVVPGCDRRSWVWIISIQKFFANAVSSLVVPYLNWLSLKTVWKLSTQLHGNSHKWAFMSCFSRLCFNSSSFSV